LTFARRTEATSVPIYLAALGPANQRMTAEIGDGWTPTPYSPDHHQAFAGPLEAEMARSGRSVELAPVAPVAVGTDRRTLHDLERRWSTFYLSSMGDYYANAARRMGFGAMVDAVRLHRGNGDLAAARNAVTPDYIDGIGLFGSTTQIAKRLQRYEQIGIDEVVLELRKKDLVDQLADLEELGRVIAS
jgi:alkanesulfonate monooxygenase SsuD/methylene tetrahydromethanopterin reductase-like flavin-dependent oxidoreductase (luciferase family)